MRGPPPELVGESGLRQWQAVCAKENPAAPGKGCPAGRVQICQGHGGLSFRMAAQEHRKCPATLFPGCGAAPLEKQYQKREREAVKDGERKRAAKKTAAATERPGRSRGFRKRHPVGGGAGPGLCAPALYDAVLFFFPGDAGKLRRGGRGRYHLPLGGREILAAEAAYSGMEAELQNYLDT